MAQRKLGNEEVPGFLEPCLVEHVAMESTTSRAPIHKRLEREGYNVHIAHSKETKSIGRLG